MASEMTTTACIAGGGPAGMMLALLLARGGVEVVVLEKHADFLRDFRGDTIHPSTLEIMHELGLLERLLARPHQKAQRLSARMGDATFTIDFSRVPTRCRFIAFMPQWEFLNFLAEEAGRYPTFKLLMQTEATGLIESAGRVTGVRATSPDGEMQIASTVVFGTDGRHSTVRAQAGLESDEFGAPMDVLWFRLPREPNDPDEPMARFATEGIFIMLNQGRHWQCGYVFGKGTLEAMRAAGLDAFKARVAELAPNVRERLREIQDWDAIKLLTVRIDRLRRWYRDGLICIGDAAHAMSPVGGVGINLAIQDAVAAANLLIEPLRAGRVTVPDLERVQKRREWPTRVTQRVQMIMQNSVVKPIVTGKPFTPPLFARVMSRFPPLQRLPARIFGVGVRPERVSDVFR